MAEAPRHQRVPHVALGLEPSGPSLNQFLFQRLIHSLCASYTQTSRPLFSPEEKDGSGFPLISFISLHTLALLIECLRAVAVNDNPLRRSCTTCSRSTSRRARPIWRP